jgi:hypothetical protein
MIAPPLRSKAWGILTRPVGACLTRRLWVLEKFTTTRSLTGESTSTFHFVLGTDRYKDNRIPPKGFDINNAAERQSQPVWEGQIVPGYFSSEEYAGGFDFVSLNIPSGAARVEVNLYYQTTSREYVEFLRDEINGTGNLTLPSGAYIVQTDPFFSKLKAWGNTVWELWLHNRNQPGAAPYLMTQSIWMDESTQPPAPTCEMPGVPVNLTAGSGSNRSVPLAWSAGDPAPSTGYNIYYDQSGKLQFITAVPAGTTTYTDRSLKQRTQYCYAVTAVNDCGGVIAESSPSNVACGTTK